MRKILLIFVLIAVAGVFAIAQEPSMDAGSGNSDDLDEGSEWEFPSFFNNIVIQAGGAITLFHGDVAEHDGIPTVNNFGDAVKRNWNVAINRDDLLNDITGGGNRKTRLGLQARHSRGSYGGASSKSKDPGSIFTVEGYYHDVSGGINYDVTWLFKGKKSKSKFRAYVNGGVGLVWFRSILFKPSSKSIHDYVGYEPEYTPDGNILRLNRGKRIKKMVFPFGMDLRFPVNAKLDFNIYGLMKYTTTDMMDAFDRPTTRKDVYSNWGIGFSYNFNRKKEDVFPSEAGQSLGAGIDLDLDDANLSESERLYKLMLKLYETQLKLFELMYLGK